jgi:hypothetical protein
MNSAALHRDVRRRLQLRVELRLVSHAPRAEQLSGDGQAGLDEQGPRSEYGRLLRESAKFGDYDLAAPWNNALLKDLIDATIWDPET